MVTAHILGYPRIGADRALKFALEAYWRGEADAAALVHAGDGLKRRHWALQSAAGLDCVAAGDFSYYDHVLDMAALLGCLPRRFGIDAASSGFAGYFAAARGDAGEPALEMTKWFDTNYHYLVPELDGRSGFPGGATRLFDDVRQAQDTGAAVKPVLVGPITFLKLSKAPAGFDRLRLLRPLAEAYAGILERLRDMGVDWVQVDEPALCLDLEPAWLDAFEDAYPLLAARAPRLLLATYFGAADEHAGRVARLPVHGVHLDLVRAPAQLERWLAALPPDRVVSAGIVDGRNVWRTDLRRALDRLRPLHDALGDRLWIAPSCSLLHLPATLRDEAGLDPEVRNGLAFAEERLDELRVLRAALERGEASVAAELDAADAALEARRASVRVRDPAVRARVARMTPDMIERRSPYATRTAVQRSRLALPPLPTTTIGSFPQTPEIRRLRADYRRGAVKHLAYLQAIRAEIRHAIERQEALGLDVLVHGEAERNDMVEFFGEQLQGYAFTASGWVQSYGSRCVKPPILYGDVARPEPMTVGCARYAQSLTEKPVKGMLTGPVTLLQWSFVRDDEPREATALQIALAIRDEVADLERAGIRAIQIDEPALREGLPLRRRDWQRYLDWAVKAFRVAAAAAGDETQIHTHMCYSEFNDILPAIAAMDADVVTIETSRSRMELLDAFARFSYPNEIGPGVYDIHSPRVPAVEEMVALLRRACEVIPPERLWVNPDCGLKTRGWAETEAALGSLVEAARRMRVALGLEAAPVECAPENETGRSAPARDVQAASAQEA